MLRNYVDLPRVVHVLALGTLVNRAGSFVVLYLTIWIRKELDLGVAFAATAMGIFGAGSFLAGLVGGDLADRFGRRPVILASLFGAALLLLALARVASPAAILATIFLLGFVADLYRPAANALVADIVSPLERPAAFALLYVALNLGFAVAAIVASFVVDHGFEWLFWGDALTTACYGVIVWIWVPETLPGGARSVAPVTRREPTTRWTTRAAAARILRDRAFLVLCSATFLNLVVFHQAFSTLPLFLDSIGHGEAFYGRLVSINGIVIVFAQLPATAALARWTRRGGRRVPLIAFGYLLTAIGFGATGIVDAPVMLALSVLVWTAGEIIYAPLVPALITDLADPSLRARYLGAQAATHSLAIIVGSPLGGVVFAHWGPAALWGGAFALASVSAAALFASSSWIERRATRAID